MDRDEKCFLWGGLLGVYLTFLVGVFAVCETRNNLRTAAIQAGVAEWTIDAKTGEKAFRWKAVEQTQENEE